jgi:predicted permease
MFEIVLQTLKYSVRSLVKQPSYSLMVAITLALGIGANTAIFSILHALVLKNLPVADPESLVVIYRNQTSLPYPLFVHFQNHSSTLDGIVAFRTAPWRVTTDGSTERVTGALVSGSYFGVLGVTPVLGAPITEEDDTTIGSGGPRGPVAVLGYGFWMRHFGGKSTVIGSPILLNGAPFTIVGVAPQSFAGTEVGQSPDVYAPMAMQRVLMPAIGSALTQPLNNWLRMIGRVKRGSDVRHAEAELTSLLQAYNQPLLESPDVAKFGPEWRKRRLDERITLLPGSAGISGLRQQYSKPLLVLMTVLGLVLLMACANIANLSLSRAAARRQEIAIRLGLGASRRRLISQLLTESLLLSVVGGVSGLFLARWGRDLLLSYLPVGQSLSASLDRNVLVFTAALAAGAAVLFGLAPALQSTNIDVAPVLKGGQSSKSDRVPYRKGLVSFQVSVSLVVVIGALLFLRSLQGLLSVDTGFARHNILLASVDVSADRYMDVYPKLFEELRVLPGVVSAALSDSGPLGTNTGWTIYVPGYTPKANEPRSSPWVGFVSPDYFKTMMVPLLVGRDFDQRDVTSRSDVMIVNETFARHYFGAESPIGRRVGLERGNDNIEIVGVVKDSKYTALRESSLRMVYVPYRPGPWANHMVIHLRTAGDPLALAPSLRQKVAELDRSAPLFDVHTVESHLDRALLRERLVATITGVFGGLALTLAALGLYGVLSYGVARRTREFGIRIAIGAPAGSILRLVLQEAAWVLGIGVIVGLTATWALGRVVSSLLFGIQPTDLMSAGIAMAVLLAAGAIAAGIPAWRASTVDPIRALRYE